MKITPSLLLLAASLAASSAASGASSKPTPGDKIEFTVPRESLSARPDPGAETRENRFNLERRESSSVSSQLPANGPLPGPDVVNRARLLQELIEHRSGMLRDELGGNAMSLDDPNSVDNLVGNRGIDDLFEHRPNRTDRGTRDDNGNRTRDRNLDKTKDRERLRGSDNDTERASTGLAGDDKSQSRTETERDRRTSTFLPALDHSSLIGRDTDRAGRPESFLDASRALSRAGSLGDHDSAATMRRAQRAEEWNRLLGRAPSDRTFNMLGGQGPNGAQGMNANLPGVPGIPGVPGPGAGTKPESLGSRVAGPAVAGNDGQGPERRFDNIMRPADLELGSGRNYGRTVLDQAASAAAPTPRPMEMLQKKHDTRLPSRDF